MVNCYIDKQIFANKHVVRSTFCNTTVSIYNIHSKDIRMILGSERGCQSIGLDCEFVLNTINRNSSIRYRIGGVQVLVIQTPHIGIFTISTVCRCVGRVIQESHKADSTVITENLIACNLNCRIRQNIKIRFNGRIFRSATSVRNSSYTVGIETGSIRLYTKGIKILTRNFNTIDIPNEVICIARLDMHSSLGTKTQSVTANVSNFINLNSIYINIYRVSTGTSTGSGLNSCYNFIVSVMSRNKCYLIVVATISNVNPLIRNIATCPAGSLNIQSNALAGTNILCVGSKLNF